MDELERWTEGVRRGAERAAWQRMQYQRNAEATGRWRRNLPVPRRGGSATPPALVDVEAAYERRLGDLKDRYARSELDLAAFESLVAATLRDQVRATMRP